MNKEEILNKYIDLIDKGYCSDCNELNCIDNFPHAKITHAIRELQQENQELKKQLEVGEEQYNDLVEEKEILQEQLSIKTLQLEEMKLSKRDYTQENILEAEKEQLNRLVNSCQEEIRRLKKQLEETNKMIEKCGFVNIEQVMLSYCGLIVQQEEFILYLRHLSNWYSADGVKQGMVNEILQKYKEIIGGKE